ncbi:MAG: hypothetical protein KGI54_17210 [Pseudomonadota bacterium]|nr:hypothetical protein [Pseudomonadota bacterium]
METDIYQNCVGYYPLENMTVHRAFEPHLSAINYFKEISSNSVCGFTFWLGRVSDADWSRENGT